VPSDEVVTYWPLATSVGVNFGEESAVLASRGAQTLGEINVRVQMIFR